MTPRNMTLLVATFALPLGGCSHLASLSGNAQNDASQSSGYDAAEFAPADFVEAVYGPDIEPAVAMFADRHFAVPMPGQLKPIGPSVQKRELVNPTDAVTAAMEAALHVPTEGRFINAIQVYPYAKGSLYRVFAAPEQVTDIALEPGEALVSVSAGDTSRWVLGDTASGSGETEQVHILVKPIEAGLTTNAMIATDRRTYHLEMVSFDDTYMAAVSWRYPQTEIVRSKRGAKPKPKPKPATFEIDSLDFAYDIRGDDPVWKPVRAFDDGRKVFIEFPEEIASSEAPPLYVLDRDGEPGLVNYRMKGHWYEVDRLFEAAELRIGGKDAEVVQIVRRQQKKRSRLAKLFGLAK